MVRLVALLCTLWLVGCSSSSKSLTDISVQKDSTVYKEIVHIDTIVIPASRVEASIDLDSLLLEYKGLLATERQGNATVTIIKEGSQIRAVATCDSVMQLLINKITELEKYKDSRKETIKEVVIVKDPPYIKFLKFGFWTSLVLVILVGGITLFISLKQKLLW